MVGDTVSDLRVGNQRKKPTKSANKRVQGVDVEGDGAGAGVGKNDDESGPPPLQTAKHEESRSSK